MKIFQIVQKDMAAMGFIPNQQQNHDRGLNTGQIIGVFAFIIDAVSFVVYFFYKANSIEEYMDLTFALTAIVGVFIGFINFILKNDDFFNLIEFVTKVLEESE